MRTSYLTSLMTLLSLFASAQSDTTKQINDLFSSWNNATPGGAVLIARGEKIIYHKAFGLADLEHNVPNTTETIFESGSVAKQFVAASALLLASEGKLSASDDVRKYIPELPTYDAPITVQHLLNHTSGLKDWGSLFSVTGWPRSTRAYTQDLALDVICKQRSLNFAPGSEYAYSNSNYVLLTFIVERISKQSLSEFTRTRFYEPLKMTSSKWRSNFRDIVPNRSIAYAKSNQVWYQEMPFENVHGPGGMLTTTADLLKWNLQLAKNTLGNDVFAASRVQHGVLNNGKEIVYSGGVSVGVFNGTKEISHSGSTAGYRAWLAYYPEKRISVILLSNDGTFAPAFMGRRIAAFYIPAALTSAQDVRNAPERQHNASGVSTNDVKKFAGIYKSMRTADVEQITFSEDKLLFNTRAMVALHKDTLRSPGRTWVYLNPQKILTLEQNGDTLSYKRVQPVDVKPAMLSEFTGNYHCSDVETSWTLFIKEDALWVKQSSLVSIKLTPVYKDAFSTGNDGLVEFRRDKRGKIIGLYISIPRAERIPFEKIKDAR